MWKVYCDEHLLYNAELEDYKIFDPSLILELNKTGSFTFTIYQNHPNYNRLRKLKSIITVYDGNYLYFRGRILNDELGWYNEKQVSCEGELAFLIDSVQRPFSFPLKKDEATPADYFSFLIKRHNEQVDEEHRFLVGRVTVTDSNNYIARSDTEYSTTWDLLNQGLIKSLGGYLWVDSDSDGKRRINYLSDFDDLCDQPVEFGRNLLSLSNERSGEDIATGIIAIGAKKENSDERVTIKALPDEDTEDICKKDDYVFSKKAISLYGKIFRKVTWDDVTVDKNLLTKAKKELETATLETQTITLTAADLHAAGQNFNSFRLGTYVTAKSTSHGISNSYLVKKLSIKLLNPASNTITVGDTTHSFTEQSAQQSETWKKQLQTDSANLKNSVIQEVEKSTDEKIGEVSSVASGAQTSVDELKKYFRVVSGKIILGLTDGKTEVEIPGDLLQSDSVIGTLQNSWENFDEAHGAVSFRKDTCGTVFVSGLIKSGTTDAGTVIFQFPTGYRPNRTERFCVGTETGICVLDVSPSGKITIVSGASAAWLSLSGICFKAGN